MLLFLLALLPPGLQGPTKPPTAPLKIQETGQRLMDHMPAQDLRISLLQQGYVVFVQDAVRTVGRIGDRIGKEQYLLIAMDEEHLFLQTDTGYVVYRKGPHGETLIQPMTEAQTPPELLKRLAETATQAP